MDKDFLRNDGRKPQEMRPVYFDPGFAPNASGSVLACFGNTRVICGVSIDEKLPPWKKAQGIPGGWLTAEYSMLPYSTHDRIQRASSKGKQDGRSIEIQRLIGRSLRAVIDLEKLGDRSLWVDCDVLQADGGTRTASITGAYVAVRLAVEKMIRKGLIEENPFREGVAAVSVGLVDNVALLDLDYSEDSKAQADCNIVMTESGKFVEVQVSGEGYAIDEDDLAKLMTLAKKGLKHLFLQQNEIIKGSLLDD